METRADSFPRQQARTRRFRLGEPRSFAVTEDGARVLFLRSSAGDDPVNSLWAFDVEDGHERLVVDAATLLTESEDELSPQERARRERVRERSGGIVAFATDRAGTMASFGLGGRLFVADVVRGGARPVSATSPAFDPRLDPAGERIAYVSGRALRVVDVASDDDRVLAEDSDPDVSWGVAEFVAAEEMDRDRGHWWSPDGRAVVAARVDESSVVRWHIASPAEPEREPAVVRYPVAGTDNAVVTLHVLGMDGDRTDVDWDGEAFPYLVAVTWPEGRPLTLLVQSRDQARWQVLTVDAGTGATATVLDDVTDAWHEIVPGVPAWTDDGRLVFVEQSEDTRRVTLDGSPVTPPGLHVRRVEHVGNDLIVAATDEDPMEVHLYRVGLGGDVDRLTPKAGVHAGPAAAEDVSVRIEESMERFGARATIRRGDRELAEIDSNAERPVVTPDVTFLRAGPRGLRAALLTPTGWDGSERLPVLMDPYGGPQVQTVVRTRRAYLESQWFADQGFAVLVVDGRGTPGRGLAWEWAVRYDFGVTLEDQVDALLAVAESHPELDLERVGIRGWSFGGYLAAMAVLRRPDVFHAAVAGAPSVDDRLYDTHYTERYLGHPDEHPDAYNRSSLLGDAANLERPLLLVHGMEDDNVVVANTLRLSRALLEAGRPHQVLPLSGITHMANEEATLENLLRLEVHFLHEALDVATDPGELAAGFEPAT